MMGKNETMSVWISSTISFLKKEENKRDGD